MHPIHHKHILASSGLTLLGAGSLTILMQQSATFVFLQPLAVGLGLLALGLTAYGLQARLRTRPLRGRFWFKLGSVGGVFLCLLLALVSVWVAYLRAVALVHPGHIAAGAIPATWGGPPLTPVQFTTPDNLRLQGWYARSTNGAAVIMVHGLGGNRGELLAEANLLAQQGYGVLVYDSRNSGASEGTISSFGYWEAQDVYGAVAFVQQQPDVRPAQIGLIGHSLGSATVLLAAPGLPAVRAVVAESVFTNVEDNVADTVQALTGLPPFPFAPLVMYFAERETGLDATKVNPLQAIADLSPRPVLIVHGERDTLLPVRYAHQLYAAAQAPKTLYLIPNAGHADLFAVGGPEYAQQLITFMDAALLAP